MQHGLSSRKNLDKNAKQEVLGVEQFIQLTMSQICLRRRKGLLYVLYI